jgi:antitoxin (DNA-binding transcriptional repressor) of toxin-antitoxin stability system
VKGEPFIIAKAGKPMVKVTSANAKPDNAVSRTGFMRGKLSVPDDFETMGNDTIEKLFGMSE